jgi:chromatin remodeling complex protein RSC6
MPQKDGREIEPDEALAKVVDKKPLSMFEMTRKVNEHLR